MAFPHGDGEGALLDETALDGKRACDCGGAEADATA